jgi:hypothetical protein
MRTKWEKRKGFLVVFVALMAAVLLSTGACAAGKNRQVNKQIEIEKIQDVDNPNAEFKVDAWVDREDGTYKIGDLISFFFKTNKDCRLTLLNVGTSGNVQILFPNEHQKDNLVKAGVTYSIPSEDSKYVFRAKGPAGEDVVKAIATLDNVALLNEADVKKTEGGIQEVTKPEKDVALELKENLKPVNPKKWAEAAKVIKIVE